MKRQVTTQNAEGTEQLAESMGRSLRGGEVIELVSDLGGGKTTFVRGLARGAGSVDHVASPTFAISKVYTAPNVQIHHYDFYRLPDAGIMTHEVQDVLSDQSQVVVVEWGDAVADVLPAERVVVSLSQAGGDARQLNLQAPDSLSYLLEASS